MGGPQKQSDGISGKRAILYILDNPCLFGPPNPPQCPQFKMHTTSLWTSYLISSLVERLGDDARPQRAGEHAPEVALPDVDAAHDVLRRVGHDALLGREVNFETDYYSTSHESN